MSVAAKLALFGLALAIVFGLAFASGRAFGPAPNRPPTHGAHR